MESRPHTEELSASPEQENAEDWVDKTVRQTPWWAASMGVHVVLIILAGIWILSVTITEEPEVHVVAIQAEPAEAMVMEPPRDIFDNKKIITASLAIENPVFIRNAESSDHNETSDNDEFEQAKGDASNFLSDKPFKGHGVYDAIGAGGGGGGMYGGRMGGRRNLVASGGGSYATESAVLGGLRWLARHQGEDGGWSADGYHDLCGHIKSDLYSGECDGDGDPQFNVGLTALSTLAFLGSGYTHLSRDNFDGQTFGDVVRKGIQYLMTHQDQEGFVGKDGSSRYMYNHAVASLALSEAYGMTGSNLFKDNAERAVAALELAQNPYAGWRYSAKSGDNDTSVTGWAVMALKSADISGLSVGREGYVGALNWIDQATNPNTGLVGYTSSNTGKVVLKGINENFLNHQTMTGVGMLSRIFIDKNRSDVRLQKAADALISDLPKWGEESTDFYYWYVSSLALFQYDGPNGKYWKQWNGALKEALVVNQRYPDAGCEAGSWEPNGRWCHEGGRVYSTALNSLTLQVYYRYDNVFGARDDNQVAANPGVNRRPGGLLPKGRMDTSKESYKRFQDNPMRDVTAHPMSTFSIDVDTASYSNMRRYVQNGQLPPADAIRIEELVNYFQYDYAPPTDKVEPFAAAAEVATCPWDPARKIVRIGLKGRAPKITVEERKTSNFVYLIDVSGSMSSANKLGLVKESFRMMLDQLSEKDRVAIVVYAGASGLVLPSTPCSEKEKILKALYNLKSGGGTNGAAGIELAYKVAKENFIKDGINRVMLCTDGDFNVGVTSESSLEELIAKKAKTGVFLSVLGFGMGNYQDDRMELLADKGNGNYAYIDNQQEANRVLVERIWSTVETIAKDVKIQVEFNPEKVKSYRLIGYVNRVMANEDFDDDTKDAGEIGSGHTVTAMYEIVPKRDAKANQVIADPVRRGNPGMAGANGIANELLTVKLRYKSPDADRSRLTFFPVPDANQAWNKSSEDYRWALAVASFGMWLRNPLDRDPADLDFVLEMATDAKGADKLGYRQEFIGIVHQARQLARQIPNTKQ